MKRCNLDNCLGFLCEFHSLRLAAQKYIRKLETIVKDVGDIVDKHEMQYPYEPRWAKEIRDVIIVPEAINADS